MDENSKTEFICVKLAEIGSKGWKRKLEWDLLARRLLADLLGLLELNELTADINIVKSARDPNVFILNGNFKALFVQECVICTGPISGSLEEDVSAKFVPTGLEFSREDIFSHLDEDHPETYSGEMLQIGKLVQDQLSLAIGPYPRHEQPQCAPLGVGANYTRVNSGTLPFSTLGKLLNKKKKNPIE